MKHNAPFQQRRLQFALACAAALGAAAIGGSAAAATAGATATTTVITPIAITKVTDLTFGSIAASGSAGTVTVNTDNARTFGGGASGLAGGTGTAAKFDITGTASLNYTISYDAAVTLAGPGPAMALTQISDLSGGGGASGTVAAGTLSAGGTQSLYIGGTLAVGANQTAGAYTANINALVNYQ